MDNRIFSDRLERLRKGEFPEDPSVFEYAHNTICEYRALFDAMRTCCALQRQKIDMLRHMNAALERSLRDGKAKIAELERKITELEHQVETLSEREGLI